MIEHLEQLMAAGKYREAIKVAEQILSDGVETPAQLVAVQSAIVEAHCRLQEYEAALVPGEATLHLAREIDDWDAFGKMAMFVSAAYALLGQTEVAVARTYDYIAHLGQYHEAAAYEILAWLNLGGYCRKLGQPADAAKALGRGLEAANRSGDHRNAHGARHALIDAYLKAHDYQPIPRLLAQTATYLRRHPDGVQVQESWAYHMRLRAEYALATGRFERAMVVALRGLERTNGAPHHTCRFHILLANIARSRNSVFEAVGHAVAAQKYARESGRPDVEAEASDLMYQVSRAYPDALATIDDYYLSK